MQGETDSRLWRQRGEQHHYLGCPMPYGAHLRYWGRWQGRELACLLWTSPAWRMKARDTWIGWTDQQRSTELAAHRQPGPLSDAALGAGRGIGDHDFGPLRPSVTRRLGSSVWLSHAPAGNFG